MAHSITRGAKIKDRRQLTSMAEHNFRVRTQDNIDSGRTHLNRMMVNKLGVDVTVAKDLNEKLTDYYRGLEIKEKADNVLMLEFIATASPEFFEGKTKAEVDRWAKAQVAFFEEEFGVNFKMACLHLDEKTPHLHIAVSTEEKKVRRFKNRHGEGVKEGYSLNAARWDPGYFVGLQDRFAKANERFGLERGERHSKATHKTLVEIAERLKVENEKKSALIKGARKALMQTKEMMNGLIDDLVSMIDIVSAKELDVGEAAEVARVAKKVRKPRGQGLQKKQ